MPKGTVIQKKENKKRSVCFITLGCRVNQYETQGMRELLEHAGLEDSADGAAVDCVVINTCTVTGAADRENRYWIRRARREHPGARLVVTGCGVEKDRARIEAMPEVDLVLANREKKDLVNRLGLGCVAPSVQSEPAASERFCYSPLSISRSEGHTRAFVKIQDGCNHACSFCKVVLVRGRSRSRPLQQVIEEVIRLRDSGYRDIVFAGIQLGAYGLDFEEKGIDLARVLEEASRIDGIERLRLSSVEPTDVTGRLIKALSGIPKCCPHLHIPLQSGDPEILARMNRRYGPAYYRALIARLRSELPLFQLSLDVMAGFPGEEETHFQNTVKLLETVKPLKCHVFPYSPRESTRAVRFENLPETLKRDRARRLIRLAERLSREARLPYLGKRATVLVETERHPKSGWVSGLTENAMKVCFPGERVWVNRLVSVELLAIEKDFFLGESHGLAF